jgi:hypothetical protein
MASQKQPCRQHYPAQLKPAPLRQKIDRPEFRAIAAALQGTRWVDGWIDE